MQILHDELSLHIQANNLLHVFWHSLQHQCAVFFRTAQEVLKDEIIELLSSSRGITVIDNPQNLDYPTPLEHADDTEEVYVGRIRSQSIKNENWVSMWIVADNVYGKGAALNAVQIIETLIENNKLC